MAKSKKDKKKKAGMGTALGIIIVTVLLIVFLKSAFVLILLGTLPTFVAFYANTDEDKMAISTVASCNLAGVLPYVAELTMKGNNLNMLSYYFGNPKVWLMMYGMAALGYILIKVCPMLYRQSMQLINSSLVFQLEQRQEALVKEWGEDIKKLG